MKKILMFVVLSLFVVALYGCGEVIKASGSVNVQKELDDGKQEAINGNLAGATAHFNQILIKDPNNPEANLMMSFLGFSSIVDKPQTKEVMDYVNGEYNMNLELTSNIHVASTLPYNPARIDAFVSKQSVRVLSVVSRQSITTANMSSKSYEYVEDVMIPALDTAIAHLQRITAKDFSINLQDMGPASISAQVSNNALDIEIDNGEVYALIAYYNIMRAVLCSVVAYDFNISNIAAIEADPMKLYDIPTFGTVRKNGANLAGVKFSILAAGTAIESGIAYIKSEKDPQYNDIIKLTPADQPDIDKVLTSITDMRAYLNGTKLLTYEITSQNVVSLDLNAFFHGALGDFKTLIQHSGSQILKLEDYQNYDWTIGGVFPNMTRAKTIKWRDLEFVKPEFIVTAIETEGGKMLPYASGMHVTGNYVIVHGTVNSKELLTMDWSTWENIVVPVANDQSFSFVSYFRPYWNPSYISLDATNSFGGKYTRLYNWCDLVINKD